MLITCDDGHCCRARFQQNANYAKSALARCRSHCHHPSNFPATDTRFCTTARKTGWREIPDVEFIMVELMFVNVGHPSQLSEAKARRKVRSHISRLQHKQKRSVEEQATEWSRSLSLNRHENTGTSQYDDSTPTLCISDVGAPVATLDSTIETSSIYRLDPPCPRRTGTISNLHDMAAILSSSISRDNRSRGLNGKDSTSWDKAAEEESEYALSFVCVTTTTPKPQRAAGPICHAAPRRYLSLHESNDGLQTFARGLKTSLTAMIVCLHHLRKYRAQKLTPIIGSLFYRLRPDGCRV